MALRWIAAALVLGACSMDGGGVATQVLVQLSFDPEVVARGQTLRLQVWDRDGESTYDRQFDMAGLDLDGPEGTVTLPITAIDDDPTRSWRFAASVIAELAVVAQVRAEGGYLAGERREVRLRFDAACLELVCGPRSSCELGGCVDACVTPGTVGSAERTMAESCAARCRPITAMGVGGRSVCAIADGELWCWGDNRFGQVGGPEEFVTAPRQVGVNADWVDVSVSEFFVCAIREQGALYCWGQNSADGRLGTGDTEDKECCTDRLRGSFRQVATGNDHACAISRDGLLHCWGRVEQLGRGGVTAGCGGMPDPCRPVRVDANEWDVVATGSRHSCAVRSNASGQKRVFCWGANDQGQLGQPLAMDYIRTPTPVEEGRDWRDVAAAGDHSCGVRGESAGRCWGDDRGEQTGCVPRDADNQPAPCEPDTGQALTDLAIGVAGSGATSGHTCAATSEGDVWCWGTNSFSETDPFQPDVSLLAPVRVAIREGFRATTVGAGFRHSCALGERGEMYCWGRNTRGELAVGDLSQFQPPQPVCITGD